MSKVLAAFDLATDCGICFGPIGGKPTVFTWDLRQGGPGRPSRLAWFASQLGTFFRENRVDLVRYEEPLSPKVANEIGTSMDTLMLLYGMAAVVEVCAVRARIFDINRFAVQDARQHLTGVRVHGRTKSGKSLGKEAVMQVALTLGVKVENDHEGDAYCGWSYCCSLQNPRIAHLVTPLFAR